MKNFLVTGGCGFIGSNFIRHLFNHYDDCRIVNLDKLTYAGNENNLADGINDDRYEFVRGDIADRELVNELFTKKGFDVVVNFAAESHVDRSIRDSSPFIDTNVKGTQILLEAARTSWIGSGGACDPDKRFIQISTDEVYGTLGNTGKFTEEASLQPNNPYAASKAGADMLCRSYYVAYDLPVIITRSSNNYGPFQFPEKLIPVVIRNFLTGSKIPVYGEGKQIRDWLFVGDNCRAIHLVLENGIPGDIYNIGGNRELTNIELVEKVCGILKEDPRTSTLIPEIDFIKDPRGKAHDYRYSLDCSRLSGITGWKAETVLEEGLKDTVNWYLENRDWMGI